MATLLAGALGVGAHYLASATGKVAEPILLGLFVFLQGYIFFYFLAYLTIHIYHQVPKILTNITISSFLI